MRKILYSTLLALTFASGLTLTSGVIFTTDAQAGSGKPGCHTAVCRGHENTELAGGGEETGSCVPC
jgi:hypothetical protein